MPNLIGKKPPNFKLNSTSGQIVELSKVKSKYVDVTSKYKSEFATCR